MACQALTDRCLSLMSPRTRSLAIWQAWVRRSVTHGQVYRFRIECRYRRVGTQRSPGWADVLSGT